MKKYLSRLLFYTAVVAAVGFSIFAFVRVSAKSDPAEPPDLGGAPQVLHGFVEPAGREVFVCAPVTKRVVAIHVSEGDTVAENQVRSRKLETDGPGSERAQAPADPGVHPLPGEERDRGGLARGRRSLPPHDLVVVLLRQQRDVCEDLAVLVQLPGPPHRWCARSRTTSGGPIPTASSI